MANNELSVLDTPEGIAALSRAELAALLAQCKALEGRLLAKLLISGDQPNSHDAGVEGDRLLTCGRTAGMLGVTPAWVYQRGRKLGLAVELGPGTLRYSRAAIEQYIKSSACKPIASRGKVRIGSRILSTRE